MAIKWSVPMDNPLFCLLRASAIAMAVCTAWVPAATIGRPHPTIRSTHGASASIRATCTWANAVATVSPFVSFKIKACARKSASKRHQKFVWLFGFRPTAKLKTAAKRHEIFNVGSNGNYWSSTPNGSDNAWNLNFNSGKVNMNNNNRCNGQSVRLVQDFTNNGYTPYRFV